MQATSNFNASGFGRLHPPAHESGVFTHQDQFVQPPPSFQPPAAAMAGSGASQINTGSAMLPHSNTNTNNNTNTNTNASTITITHTQAKPVATTPSAHHNNTPVPIQRNQAHNQQNSNTNMNTNNGSEVSPSAGAARPPAKKSSPGQQLLAKNSVRAQVLRKNSIQSLDPSKIGIPASPAQGAQGGQGGPTPAQAPLVRQQQEELNARFLRRNTGNAAIMRILDLVELVSSAPYEVISTFDFWGRVCSAFFRNTSVLRFAIPAELAGNSQNHYRNGAEPAAQGTSLYQLNMSTAPRFFLAHVLAQSVVKHDVFLTGFKFQILNGGFILLVCRLTATFHYRDGSSGTASGTCRFLMSRDLFIQQLDCHVHNFHKSISLDALERRWAKFSNMPGSSDTSPYPNSPTRDFYSHVANDAECFKYANNAGISDNAMRMMRIGDVMACLHPLMRFARSSKISSPLKALDSYVQMSANDHHRASVSSAQNSSQTGNGACSSPSPKSLDEHRVVKKRRTSSTMQSPMTQGSMRG